MCGCAEGGRWDRWRRGALTGLAFLLFGVGGALLASIVAVSVVLDLRGGALRRKARMRRVLHRIFRLFVRMLRAWGLLDFRWEGLDRLRPGALVIANHPSLLDVVFLIAMIPNADCVVRAGLRRSPLTALPVRVAGFILNDHPAMLERARRSLAEGATLIIFPEGSRSPPGALRPFQRGAAHIALASGALVQAVTIRCAPPVLTKHSRWYHVPPARPCFRFTVHPAWPPQRLDPERPAGRQARDLTARWRAWFASELGLDTATGSRAAERAC